MKTIGTPNLRSTPKRAPAVWLCLALSVAACTNSNRDVGLSSRSRNTTNITTSTSAPPSLRIGSIQLTTGTSGGLGGQTTQQMLIYFDATGTTRSIREFCSLAAPKLCRCQLTWQEQNSTGNATQTINRKIFSPLTNVQQSLASCSLPDLFTTEIPNGTIVRVSVTPASGNSSSFSVPPFNYTKGNLSISGNFQDSEGRKFQNVYRYTCFDRSKRGMTLRSKSLPGSFSIVNSNSEQVTKDIALVTASQFCESRGRDAAGRDVDGCGTQLPPNPEISAQSYYYNLYVRNTDLGSINGENASYLCPTIQEPIFANPSNPGAQGNFYPLDSTFALALQPYSNFNVGVEARSRIGVAGDPNSVNQTCTATGDNSGGSGNTTPSSGIVSSCLGYAAKPNADGTCPYFTDTNGQIRMMYRLRRYTALYPLIWDTTGANMPNEGARVDQVYVLDRPVSFSQGDPLKPYTMRGPKPCPFAYYDWASVAGNNPAYRATNHPGWERTNPDGIQFPNVDSYVPVTGPSSCSAVLPIVNSTRDIVTLGTVHESNPVFKMRYVRPGSAWAPTYLEDTDFQACAPESNPMRDAPLHIAKDGGTGTVAWCSEVYPNFNPSLQTGTTHADAGRRTVISNSNNAHTRYPLIAQEDYVEAALRSDSTYGCLLTYDNAGGKSGTQSPSGGCCRRLISGENITTGAGTNAREHFDSSSSEPNPCLIPTY